MGSHAVSGRAPLRPPRVLVATVGMERPVPPISPLEAVARDRHGQARHALIIADADPAATPGTSVLFTVQDLS